MSSTPATSTSEYVFDNSAEAQAGARFTALPRLFDPGTILHFDALGVGPGWACLEVGAGGGSIARWLAERVGETGQVVATDIDPRFLQALEHPAIEVWQHDITADPLPEAAFDLVHTRLVLAHLAERDVALARMAAALRPGGWLLIEEFDSLSMPPDAAINPVEERFPLYGAMLELMQARAVDLRYGRLLPGYMPALGLDPVDAEGRVLLWSGGSTGAELLRANFEQLREPIMRLLGLDAVAFDRELARLDDPAILNPAPVLWAVWGQKPDEPLEADRSGALASRPGQ